MRSPGAGRSWRRGLVGVVAAAALVVTMAPVVQAEPLPDPTNKRRPEVPGLELATGQVPKVRTAQADKDLATMPDAEVTPSSWSEGTATVDTSTETKQSGSDHPGLAQAGDLDVHVGPVTAEAITDSGLDVDQPHKTTQGPDSKTSRQTAGEVGTLEVTSPGRKVTDKLGLTGVVVALEADTTKSQNSEVPDGESDDPEGEREAADDVASSVGVQVDYADFAAGQGADWAARARLVALPACAVTTPEKPECQEQDEIVESVNDPVAGLIAAVVDHPATRSTSVSKPGERSPDGAEAGGGVVFAVTAGASGSTGDFVKTSLAPSGSWVAGDGGGGFAWSYPLRTPEVGGGLAPDLSLDYSSSAVDGRTTSTNNQPSWIGEGWDLSQGYIERSYRPCLHDMSGGTNTVKTGDLCWAGDNATVSFGAHSGELVQSGSSNVWRLRDDDGTRFEKLTSLPWTNGDNDREYWRVTTTDGMRYFFGRGRATDGSTETKSTWTVPVFGNHSGEPCAESSFGSSSCAQAWRWNLDYVVDTNNNSATSIYVTESNRYGLNNNASSAAYIRGGYLARIDYGQRAGTEASGDPAARVVFTVAERCLVTSSQTCTSLTAATASAWPDVPQDQLCTSTTTCAGKVSPTFFSRKRLTQVRTQVWSGSAFTEVERWDMAHKLPQAGDGNKAALWLTTIQHAAAGGAAAMPKVRMGGIQKDSRVDGVEDTLGQVAAPMIKWRLRSIATESGGEVLITYAGNDCSPTSLPSPQSNTKRCFPVYWTPPGAVSESRHWFHKYVVSSVNEHDLSGASDHQVLNSYTYSGGTGWAYDDSVTVVDKHRSWNQWRGYLRVKTITGETSSASSLRTDALFYRGLHGDRAAPSGGTKTVTVTDTEGGEVTDSYALQGLPREEITYTGPSGSVVEKTIHDQTVLSTTATNSAGRKAQLADVTKSRTYTTLSSGGPRISEVRTSYDGYGMVVEEFDRGDVHVAGDDLCTRTGYARDTTDWVLDRVATTKTRATTCDGWPATPITAQVVADERMIYDGLPLGQVSKGNQTRADSAKSVSGGTISYATLSSTGYDALGRPTQETDALGRVSTTAYTPTGAGPVTKVVETSPDPDGSGALTAHVTSSNLEVKFGQPTKMVDPAGGVTEATYDGYGRLTGVWEPGRPKASKTANATYKYTTAASGNGPSAVTSKELLPSEQYKTTVEIVDGLMRPRQVQQQGIDQKVDANGNTVETVGRSVSDTLYDARGLVIAERGPTFASGAPSTAVLNIIEAQVPTQTKISYDGAGRETKRSLVSLSATKWSTTFGYGGDRVHTTPPVGGTATTEIADVRGRTTALRQYHGSAPTGAFDETTYTHTPGSESTAGAELASMTDPAGNTWSYTYDLLGRQTKLVDPDAGTSHRSYDDAGQLVTSTDGRGEKLAYTYDTLGRKTSLRDDTTSGAVRSSWSYDTLRKGVQTSQSRYIAGTPVTATVTEVDAAGRPARTETVIPEIPGWIEPELAQTVLTITKYKPDGSLDKHTIGATGSLPAETFSHSYDSIGRPRSLGGTGAYVVGAVYSGVGKLMQITTGNQVPHMSWTTWAYDEATGRMKSAQYDRESIAKADLLSSYTYTNAGTLTKQRITHPQTNAAADTQCFNTDHLQRLTRAWTPADGNCNTAPTVAGLGGPAPYWQDWTFDKASNRTSQTSHTTTGDEVTTWTHPSAGGARPHASTKATTAPAGGGAASVAEFGYDAGGNTTSRDTITGAVPGHSSVIGQGLSWDPEGRLVEADSGGDTTSFAYTPDGDRFLRRDGETTTLYTHDAEVTLTRATGDKTTIRHVNFGEQTVALRTGPNMEHVKTLWSLLNNTATWQVDAGTGALKKRRTLPYGETRGPSTGFIGTHGFVDGLNDPDLGLVRIGARDYDPTQGRFLTPDPIIDPKTPSQWNAYGYGNGNPISFPDPTGLRPDDFSAREYGHYLGARKAGQSRGKAVTTAKRAAKKEASRFSYRAPKRQVRWPSKAAPHPDRFYNQYMRDGVAPIEWRQNYRDTGAHPGCNGDARCNRIADVQSRVLLGAIAFPIPGGPAIKGFNLTYKGYKASRGTSGAAKTTPQAFRGPIADGVPKNLPQQLALGAAKDGQGSIIMRGLGDVDRLTANYGPGEWVKMQYVMRGNESNVVVHYFRNLTTKTDVEFKFK